MSSTNTTQESPDDSVMYVCATFVMLFNFISVVGHGLLFVAISKRRLLQTNANGYVISLAIADLLFAVVCLPAVLANYWAHRNLMSDIVCKTQNFLSSIANGVAMWHVGFMAMNHYVLMAYHEHYIKYTTRQATFTQLIFTWALPILVVVAAMTGSVRVNKYQPRLLRCAFESTSTISTVLFSTILDAVLPGAIAITAFTLSVLLIRKRHLLVWSEISLMQSTRINKDDIGAVKVYMLVFARVVIAYIPPMFNRSVLNKDVPANLCVILDCLSWCLMCVNPIIYATMHRQFRTTFQMLLSKDGKVDLDDEEEEEGGNSKLDIRASNSAVSAANGAVGPRQSTCSSVGLASSWARRASMVY